MRRLFQATRLIAYVVFLLGPGSSEAISGEPIHPDLHVAVKEAPPFVIREPGGGWSGMSMALWEEIAARLGYSFDIEEVGLQELIDGAASGRFDVGVAPLTITGERERHLDFTHSYFSTGLGIVVAEGAGRSWAAVLHQVVSSGFLQVIGAFCLLLLAIGGLVWILERRRNPEQFGGSAIQGIGAGFWWSAVTMTTVGFGDKAPKSFLGRAVAIVWMFAAIMMISGFTASITSLLTVTQLGTVIEGPDDLARVKVGAVSRSTSAQYLDTQRIAYVAFDDVQSGIQAVEERTIDAMVHDLPVLRYQVLARPRGELRVLALSFEPQQYGFALTEGAMLREPINRVLLDVLSSDSWTAIQEYYLGE